MASNIGNILKITIFGESHSKAIGMTIDGLPAGVKINKDYISVELSKRQPKYAFETSRKEMDRVEFLCGVLDDKTTGSPLTFIIKNADIKSENYKKGEIRPSHADLVSYLKYNGFNDYRGGGFSSGRLTAPIVVLGAICKSILAKKGIIIGSHISSIHGINDIGFNWKYIQSQIIALEGMAFPTLSDESGQKMMKEIENALEKKDSVGGTIETVVIGCPVGLGEPYFDSVESYISQLLFSVGGIKGVSFGDGFGFSKKYGSEVKDELQFIKDKIVYKGNHNGGINGGISNGQPIIINTAIKPISSIGKPMNSINIETKENIKLEIEGRHDVCIVNRVRPVIESLTAFALLDLLMVKESKNI